LVNNILLIDGYTNYQTDVENEFSNSIMKDHTNRNVEIWV